MYLAKNMAVCVPVFEYYLLTPPVMNPQLLKDGGKVFCRKPKYQDSILRWYYEQKAMKFKCQPKLSSQALIHIVSSRSIAFWGTMNKKEPYEIQTSTQTLIWHCKVKVALLRYYEQKKPYKIQTSFQALNSHCKLKIAF